MKNIGKGILIFFGVMIVFIGISYAFGWVGVHQTSTIKKAQQNAERKVFEETQSYIEGKRQEATKYRLEYLRATSETEKKAIKSTIAMSFANFKESKLESPELEAFVKRMKYSIE